MAPFPTLTTTAGRAQHLPATQVPTLDTSGVAQPATLPSEPHNIHYLEDGVQEDATYRVQWSDWMSDGNQQSAYKHVFVLLLSWHPECDDMDVDPEVQRLKNVFENIYNYNVESFQIDSRVQFPRPQAQANLAVAKFVSLNEKEDTLFIVYYAGHGSPGKDRGDLKLTGRRRQEGKRVAQQFSHVDWHSVENNLRMTRADVLLIFDCCHASDLGRDSGFNSKSFESLAASTSSYTRSPGKQSFTSALIWALEKLARRPPREALQECPMFTTSKLAKTIWECPDFPKEQKPSLTTRDVEAWQLIFLAPLPADGVASLTPARNSEDEDEGEEEDEDDKPNDQFLSLTFHFKHKQSESVLLKKLADHLKKFMLVESSLHNVQWGGLWGGLAPPPGHRLRAAVRKVLSNLSQRRLRRSSISPALPSVNAQNDRLSPQAAHHPQYSPTFKNGIKKEIKKERKSTKIARRERRERKKERRESKRREGEDARGHVGGVDSN